PRLFEQVVGELEEGLHDVRRRRQEEGADVENDRRPPPDRDHDEQAQQRWTDGRQAGTGALGPDRLRARTVERVLGTKAVLEHAHVAARRPVLGAVKWWRRARCG